MKILFISRASLYKDPGGDTIQIKGTAHYLRAAGCEVDIKLSDETIDYSSYHLVHFFNIIRPADILIHIQKSGKPYLVSPIYVDYSEYDQKNRSGLAGLVFRLLPGDSIEYLKTIARRLLTGEKIMSAEYLWKGQYRSIQQILKHAAFILPNSLSELKRLKHRFAVDAPALIVPNGIDSAVFGNSRDPLMKDPSLIICVARIEGRKNQLNLIKALNNTSFRLLLIGQPALNQKEYYLRCRNTAASNIEFLDKMPQSQLVDYYQRAHIHVLASWFETTGLSSLEAASMGCKVVITDKGDARDYFGDHAFYCDPGSPESIRKAVEAAAKAESPEVLIKKIKKEYTWQQAALKTYEAYTKIPTNN